MRVPLQWSTRMLVLALIAAVCVGALVFIAGGCATAGDIREIAQAQGRFERSLTADLTHYKAGVITDPQFEQSLKDRGIAFRGDVAAVEQRVDRRVDEAASQAFSFGDGSLIATGITALGMIALNLYRNRTRAIDPRVTNNPTIPNPYEYPQTYRGPTT